MLLRNLTKFSQLESLCSIHSRELVLSHNSVRNLKNKFNNMGCSISKQVKITDQKNPADNQSNQTITETRFRSTMPPQDDYIEGIVCKDSDIQEKEMKVFDLQDAGKVLLVRQNGKLSALGNKCTHYGAPLEKSALGDGRIRCQWHGACFNLTTGDIEDFPGLDSLPCYQVTVENDNVKVRARRSELASNKRIKDMAGKDPYNCQHFVVLGGGPSGSVCVETLRQEGFQGRITLIAKEKYLPYDRILVNKKMDAAIKDLQFRTPQFYSQHGIDILTDSEAVQLDTKKKLVKLRNGTVLVYDALYIATGSSAKKPNIPGADLQNVLVLREYDDAVYALSQISPTKHVVVLGSSFIGMEAAAYCIDKVERVTIVSRDSVPYQAAFGPEVGKGVMNLYEEKGAHFVMKSGLVRCNDNGEGAVGSVELVDGTILQADICIMGTGSTLNTGFLDGAGLNICQNGAVEVDEYLQSNADSVFVGGDIAHAPIWARKNVKASVGHFGLAEYHGRMAALNMLNKKTPIKVIPFFWSTFLARGIRYVGYGQYDDIIYSGEPTKLQYVAFYLKDDEVVAVSACGMDPIVSRYAEYVAQGKVLSRSDLAEPLAWVNW